MPKVFISYSHDSEEHAARVRALADALVRGGVDVALDLYNPVPKEGWPLWMETNLEDADFVLMVCTPIYFRRVMRRETPGVGLGVQWEGNLIYNRLYQNGAQGDKYLPVLLDGADKANIPTPLQGYTYFRLTQFSTDDTHFRSLYRHLTAQPATPKPELGSVTIFRGSKAYIVCNRDKPSFTFRDAIKYDLDQPKPYGVHCYIVEGTDDDCPGSFIQRLLQFELKQLADERPPVWWKGIPECVEAVWECRPTDSPEQALDMLKESIIVGLTRNDRPVTSTVIPNWEFHTRLLRAAQNQPVIAIGHSIVAGQWHDGMEQLLTLYLQLLAALPDTSPLILLFFTLEDEVSLSLLRFLGRGRTERALEAMQRIFGDVAQRQSTVRYSPLGKLEEVDEQHVARMLRNIDTSLLETQIQQRLQPLFRRRKRVKMADVERYFNETDALPYDRTGGKYGR